MLQSGQGVIIVDAGGGTVDLSAYFMTVTPASFEEIAPTECNALTTTQLEVPMLMPFIKGRLQGSVFVSRRARVFLEGIRGPSSSLAARPRLKLYHHRKTSNFTL